MDRPLTPKQQRFVEEYLVDLNGTQAAIRAGYSSRGADVAAIRLLADARIAALVAKVRAETSARTAITVDYVLNGLREIAERCLQKEQVLDRKGDPVLVETPGGDLAAAFTFQASAGARAFELLGKHLGMFVERVEHSGKVEVEDVSEQEVARRVAFLLAGKPAPEVETKH